jgi:hypothetical protein
MRGDTDLTDGEQYELTVTAVSACSLGIGDTRVTRHTIESEAGERFAVLVAPGSGGLVPLEPGETYGCGVWSGLDHRAGPTTTRVVRRVAHRSERGGCSTRSTTRWSRRSNSWGSPGPLESSPGGQPSRGSPTTRGSTTGCRCRHRRRKCRSRTTTVLV